MFYKLFKFILDHLSVIKKDSFNMIFFLIIHKDKKICKLLFKNYYHYNYILIYILMTFINEFYIIQTRNLIIL